MVVSVSGRGVKVLITSDRAPISFSSVGYGSFAPDGMYLPPETVMGLIPLLDVATRVGLWLQKNPEYPKHSGCILAGSGFSSRLGKAIQ
jgi:hypothetical protein